MLLHYPMVCYGLDVLYFIQEFSLPYIKQERRNMIRETVLPVEMNAGDLNYLITECINIYRFNKKDSYQTFNDIVGALGGAKLEFYRRVVGPYEDRKIKENGDVYHIETPNS